MRAGARSTITLLSVLAIAATVVVAPRPTAATVEEVGQVELSYQIGSAGRVSTDLDAFANHVGATLDDPDGWSLGGSIELTPVRRGGDFRVLIAQPAVIGDIAGCSPRYSCHVSGDVYINEDRWNRGAPGWSLGLGPYRHYVINHEVGHYLGLDHRACPGPGEPAPVMAQQSIETEPCRNRVWPLAAERRAVADRYGVPVLSPSAEALGYVTAAHLRTLQRPPSEEVANDAALRLDRGALGRIDLVSFLFASREFRTVPAAVSRVYFASFGRPPEPGGLFHWGHQLQTGRSLTAVADAFARSAEFRGRYGDLGPGDFVVQLYGNVLGRRGEDDGVAYWTSELRSGRRDRGGVLTAFAQSGEHRSVRRAETTVAAAYVAILDRRADAGGLTYWSDRLKAGTPVRSVLASFRASSEAVL